MLITAPDGRSLEVFDSGGDGLPCVFHGGTPAGPVPHGAAIAAAGEVGLRWITYARPGYGESTPLAGRTVAQAAEDTTAVLDALGLEEFVTYGWSGGGPHALACAALLPDRCQAAATVASVAPYGVEGLDFLDGMGEENVEEFGLAVQGRAALAPYLREQHPVMSEITGEQVAEAMGGLISEVDQAALTGELADYVSECFRAGLRAGIDGWLDDDLAFAKPWGFALDELRVPVAIWQGAADLMVPFAHGQWLAANVSGATERLLDEVGHVSLVRNLRTILGELLDSGRR